MTSTWVTNVIRKPSLLIARRPKVGYKYPTFSVRLSPEVL